MTKRIGSKKIVDELRNQREDCFSIVVQRYQRLKNTFAAIRVSSSEKGYVDGDATRAIKWIDREVESFGEILSTSKDYCAWIGARSTTSIFEKASCKHIKTIGQPDFMVSLEDVKSPLAKPPTCERNFTQTFRVLGEEIVHRSSQEKQRKRFCLVFNLLRYFANLIAYRCFSPYRWRRLQGKPRQLGRPK